MPLQGFSEQGLQDIGRVTVLAGAVRARLRTGVQILLDAPSHLQGFGPFMLRDVGFGRLCVVFQRIAVVPTEVLTRFEGFVSLYTSPMQEAADISTGNLTYIGGGSAGMIPASFALGTDIVVRGTHFGVDSRVYTDADFSALAQRLAAACEEANTFSGIRLVVSLLAPKPPADTA